MKQFDGAFRKDAPCSPRQNNGPMPRLRDIATTTAAAGLMLAGMFATETALAVKLYGSVDVGPSETRDTIVSVNQTNSNISYTIGDPTNRGGLTGLAFPWYGPVKGSNG